MLMRMYTSCHDDGHVRSCGEIASHQGRTRKMSKLLPAYECITKNSLPCRPNEIPQSNLDTVTPGGIPQNPTWMSYSSGPNARGVAPSISTLISPPSKCLPAACLLELQTTPELQFLVGRKQDESVMDRAKDICRHRRRPQIQTCRHRLARGAPQPLRVSS